MRIILHRRLGCTLLVVVLAFSRIFGLGTIEKWGNREARSHYARGDEKTHFTGQGTRCYYPHRRPPGLGPGNLYARKRNRRAGRTAGHRGKPGPREGGESRDRRAAEQARRGKGSLRAGKGLSSGIAKGIRQGNEAPRRSGERDGQADEPFPGGLGTGQEKQRFQALRSSPGHDDQVEFGKSFRPEPRRSSLRCPPGPLRDREHRKVDRRCIRRHEARSGGNSGRDQVETAERR